MSRYECQSNIELFLTHTHSHYIFAKLWTSNQSKTQTTRPLAIGLQKQVPRRSTLNVECLKVTNEEVSFLCFFRAVFHDSVNIIGTKSKVEGSSVEIRQSMQFQGCRTRVLDVVLGTRERFKFSQNFASILHAYPRERPACVGCQMQMRMQWPCIRVYVCYRRPDFGRLPAPFCISVRWNALYMIRLPSTR